MSANLISTGAIASMDASYDKGASIGVTINYDKILGELCRKIDGASYYSGSSSTYFFRGFLAKYEQSGGCNISSKNLFSSLKNNKAFSPRGLTENLLEKLLVENHSDDSSTKEQEDKIRVGNENEMGYKSDQNFEKLIIVAQALAGETSKYLPAIAASLSSLVSSKISISIPREFLQLWVTAIIDDSTPDNLHNQLSDDLFRIIQQQRKLSDSCDSLALPTHALSCLIKGDSWHAIDSKSKILLPPSTETTLRRVSLLVRFLSHDAKGAPLDSEIKCGIATTSGATRWFLEVLNSESCPVRHQKQHHETSLGIIDLLLDECRLANDPNSNISVEWLFAPELAEASIMFFQETIRELLEDWDAHLQTLFRSPLQSTTRKIMTTEPQANNLTFQTNREVMSGENRKVLCCATRFIQFLARLPPGVCHVSSLEIAREASKKCQRTGKDLLASMLSSRESPLQRLRLVRLLIDEFGNSYLESDSACAERKKWLSSPGILVPIMEVCYSDPFLGSSEATDRFLNAYGDASWRSSLSNKPRLRKAPEAISCRAFEESGGSEALAVRTAIAAAAPPKPVPPISRWLSETADKFGKFPASGGGVEGDRKLLSVLRNKMSDRLFGNRTQQENQYGLFDEGNRVTGTATFKAPQDQYSLFNGQNGAVC